MVEASSESTEEEPNAQGTEEEQGNENTEEEPTRFYYFNRETNFFVYSTSHHYANSLQGLQVYNAAASLQTSEPFIKIADGAVQPMNPTEKNAEALRLTHLNAPTLIDAYVVRKIINEGFTFNNQAFSLSKNAQQNWNRIATLALTSNAPSTFKITAQNAVTVDLKNEDVATFLNTANTKIENELSEGRELKNALNVMQTAQKIIAHLTINGVLAANEQREYL